MASKTCEGDAVTDTRFAPVDAPERETVREPAKAWFNWWRIISVRSGFPLGIKFKMGPHPSRDVAESRAHAEQIDLFTRTRVPPNSAEFVGALPEGERP